MDTDSERVVALEQRLLDPGVRASPERVSALLHLDFVLTSRGVALRSSIWTRGGVGSWLLRVHQGTTVGT